MYSCSECCQFNPYNSTTVNIIFHTFKYGQHLCPIISFWFIFSANFLPPYYRRIIHSDGFSMLYTFLFEIPYTVSKSCLPIFILILENILENIKNSQWSTSRYFGGSVSTSLWFPVKEYFALKEVSVVEIQQPLANAQQVSWFQGTSYYDWLKISHKIWELTFFNVGSVKFFVTYAIEMVIKKWDLRFYKSNLSLFLEKYFFTITHMKKKVGLWS